MNKTKEKAMNNVLVSCVIPTYKRSDTLRRAIDSVVAQTYKILEILIVDDNEKDTPESKAVEKIVTEYPDSRVKLVTQPKHINGAEARNAGVRASTGEYIAFLDDDDEWLTEKIEKQLNFIALHPGVDGVSCLYSEYTNGVKTHSCPPYNCNDIHKKIFQREVAVLTSTVLLNKAKLLESGLFDVNLRRHQDLQLLLDFTCTNRLEVLNEYLVKLHSDSAINRPNLERFIAIKDEFFHSVGDHFSRYSRKEQKNIKAAHYFEVVKLAISEKKIPVACKYLLKIGLNFKAFRMILRRIRDKKFICDAE